MTGTQLAPSAPARPLGRLVSAGRQQGFVATGQLLAGAGNLVFVACAARLLDARAFSQAATFVALHTALHLPGAGLAAISAFDPNRFGRLLQRCAIAGGAVAIALALAAGGVAEVIGLPPSMVYGLAAAAPTAALLGLCRGVTYGRRQHGALVRSLLVEPATRCTLGVALAVMLGAPGAAWGVVLGGWFALASLTGIGMRADAASAPSAASLGAAGISATGITFVVLALVQHQDLVVANRLLDDSQAGAFAALSTLGGLVAFATATLPFVVLAPSSRREPAQLTVALGATVVIGLGAVLVAALAPRPVIAAVVGPEYFGVAPYLAPYVAAMAALGGMRVLAAHHCASGHSRRVVVTVALTAVAQLSGLLVFGRDVGSVVVVSAATLGTGAATLAMPPSWIEQARLGTARALRPPDRDVLFIVAVTVIAFAVRVATNRGIWLDEATSIAQARMSFGDMLQDLRVNDVHPPLHHMILWLTTRVLGTSEQAVRLPSIVAGALTVPALYALGRALFDKRTARLVAVLAVLAPFLVWYSQEARMYALFILAGVCSVWAQVVAMRTGRLRAFVAWGFAMAAVLWTQWFGLLPVFVQLVAATAMIIRRRRDMPVRRLFAGLGVAVVVLAVLFAPLVPFLADQLAAYRVRGAGLSTTPSAVGLGASGVEREAIGVYAVIANGIWALTGYHADRTMEQLGALWPLGVLAALLALGRRFTDGAKLVVAVAVVPALALFMIGSLKRDLFELRYFALFTPMLLVLIARAATTLARGTTALVVVTTLLMAISTVALVDQQGNGTNPRLYDFRGAVHEIVANGGPSTSVALEPSYLDLVVRYYGPELRMTGVQNLKVSSVGRDGIDVLVAERFVGSEQASALVGKTLYELEERFGPPERIEHPNVVVWRFR